MRRAFIHRRAFWLGTMEQEAGAHDVNGSAADSRRIKRPPALAYSAGAGPESTRRKRRPNLYRSLTFAARSRLARTCTAL